MDKFKIVSFMLFVFVVAYLVWVGVVVAAFTIHPYQTDTAYRCWESSGTVIETTYRRVLIFTNQETHLRVLSKEEFIQHCGDK